MLPTIEKVVVDNSDYNRSYLPKVVVFKTNKFLLDRYTPQYLEDNKIFALCFDCTPIEDLDSMEDYNELLKYYPNSCRLPTQKYYVGDLLDTVAGMYRILDNIFTNGYEIIDNEFGI